MNTNNSIIPGSSNYPNIEAAIKELGKNGVDISRFSLVGKDYHSEKNVVGYYNTGDRIKYWGSLGAFLPMQPSCGYLVIGPIVVGGPIVTALIGTTEGAF